MPPVGDGSGSEEKVQSKVIKGLGELRCEMSNLEKAQVSFGRGRGGCGASLLGGARGTLLSLVSYNHAVAVSIFGIGKLADPIL